MSQRNQWDPKQLPIRKSNIQLKKYILFGIKNNLSKVSQPHQTHLSS